MTTIHREQPAEAPSRQAEQARLVQDGRKLAGVAEAIEVYERINARAGAVNTSPPVPRYATGGNA